MQRDWDSLQAILDPDGCDLVAADGVCACASVSILMKSQAYASLSANGFITPHIKPNRGALTVEQEQENLKLGASRGILSVSLSLSIYIYIFMCQIESPSSS